MPPAQAGALWGGRMVAPELVIGSDFAGPARAADQRRKILALAAERLQPSRYRVGTRGFNAHVFLSPRPG